MVAVREALESHFTITRERHRMPCRCVAIHKNLFSLSSAKLLGFAERR
jgi:hypothetical protein